MTEIQQLWEKILAMLNEAASRRHEDMDLGALVGKTIATACIGGSSDATVVISFTDGSWIQIEPYDTDSSLSLDKYADRRLLSKAGVLPPEYAELSSRYDELVSIASRVDREARERSEYERLREKFEA